LVENLLKKGADPNAITRGQTPLHSAIFPLTVISPTENITRNTIVKLLLDKGANVLAKTKGELFTPLHYAVICNNYLSVVTLINHARKQGKLEELINAKSWAGTTALHLASIARPKKLLMDFYYIAKLLLDHGANINERDAEGNTPLHYAASNHSPELVELLLKRGADVLARNKNGQTPLFKVLDMCRRDVYRDTYYPYDLRRIYYVASESEQHEIVKVLDLLLNHAAKQNKLQELLSTKNKENMTAIEYAQKIIYHSFDLSNKVLEMLNSAKEKVYGSKSIKFRK